MAGQGTILFKRVFSKICMSKTAWEKQGALLLDNDPRIGQRGLSRRFALSFMAAGEMMDCISYLMGFLHAS
jgi:hypothetical protein